MGRPTAGPWKFCEEGQWHIRDAAGNSIMCDEQYYPWVPNNEADWNLIAAAPELYASLKAILGFFDSGEFVRDTSHDFEQGWHLKMIPVVKSLSDANAALCKAEGKVPSNA